MSENENGALRALCDHEGCRKSFTCRDAVGQWCNEHREPRFVPTGCDCDAIDGYHDRPGCAIYEPVQTVASSGSEATP